MTTRLKPLLFLAALLTFNTMTQAQATRPASQSDIPIRSVTLFSSGVGYFEHGGTVSGNTSTELRFKTGQINDILKSLLLQDMDGGVVTSVNYASQEPLERKLRSFQIDISGSPTLGSLLAQLRGARVTLQASDRSLSGVILGVETRQVGQGQSVVERTVLTLLSGGAIKTELLEEVREIKLDDPALQDELVKALEALAGARDQEKKTVTLNFSGQGTRRVRLGYVVETPVWKTSYRLVLGGGEARPSIQGWAIVENQTDRDWGDVRLSLVSGRPISFVQDLYTPLFVPRPVVAPELYASLRPQQYDPGVSQMPGSMEKADAMPQRQLRTASRAPAAAPAISGGMAMQESDMASPMDISSSIQSVASAARMGELFQYTVGNVTLPRQTSAMIPIITDPLEVEKLSVYRASVLPRNPLTGARLKNTTGKHLLSGPVTVLSDGGYAGDARIDNVPPGQTRLLTYGIDLELTVDATRRNTTQNLETATISRGVLRLVRKNVETQEYLLDNKGEKQKIIVIEHPRKGGDWKFVDTEKPVESTDDVHRFQTTVAGGKQSKLTVKEETTLVEGVALLNFGVPEYTRFMQTGAIPQPVKDALSKAADLRRAIVETERQIELKTRQLADISTEQNRIRENLRTIQQNTDLYRRLVEKLSTQENTIETLQSEQATLRKELETRQKALSDYLTNLNVG